MGILRKGKWAWIWANEMEWNTHPYQSTAVDVYLLYRGIPWAHVGTKVAEYLLVDRPIPDAL